MRQELTLHFKILLGSSGSKIGTRPGYIEESHSLISPFYSSLCASISQSIYHILLSMVYILLFLSKIEAEDVSSIVLFLHQSH